MKKSWLVLVSILCVVAFASTVCLAGAMPKIAEKQTITFNNNMLLAGNELPAGTYTVIHQMQGDDHYMVFHQKDVAKDKAVEVRVKCNLVALEGKASRTERRYIQNAKNQNVLTELTFAGDHAKHVFETPAL